MKMQSFTIGLFLAAAFLVATNIQADLLTVKPTAESGYKIEALDSYSVYYNGETLVASSGNLQRNADADLFGNMGWSYSVAAPNEFSYFTLSRGTNGGDYGPINLTINGKENSLTFMDMSFNEWWFTAYMNYALFDWSIYFNDKADGNGVLNLDFLTLDYVSIARDRSNPDFVLTFYNQSPIAGEASPVPEPATLAVLGLGLAGLGMVSRRRRK